MKTPIKVISLSIATAAFAFTAQGQNLLSDPSFESGSAVGSGMGGWGTFNGAHFSTAFARTGVFSMDNAGGGNFSVPGAFQFVPAQAGISYLLTGFAFVPTALPGGTSEGFLQITFVDSTTTVNLGTVQTSPGNALLSSVVNSSSPTGTWIPLSVTATAPAGTAYAEPFTLVLDQNPTTVYFDDLSLTAVPAPEPSTLALAGLGFAGMFYFIRRRGVAKALTH
jgi:hypothetical protein